MARDQDFYRRAAEAGLAAYNEGNLDALDEFYAPGFVYHRPPYPDLVGLAAYKKYIADLRTAYPDWHVTVEMSIQEGDFRAYRGTWQGTLTGRSVVTGIKGTGQKVNCAYCNYARWEGTQLVEIWSHNDYLTMMQQLGYTLTPPEATE